jgi:hypothetical protein
MESKEILLNISSSLALKSPYTYLPKTAQPWPRPASLVIGPDNDQDDIASEQVLNYASSKLWTCSGQTIYFFCDIHADTDAFFLSLVASGGVLKTGAGDTDFELTEEGRHARFIIGGDCFDKGPDNLRLLEAIHQLYLKGAELILLAGNHDIRTYLGIFYAESKEPLLDHLFVRMGKKTVPLLAEIYTRFVKGTKADVTFNDASIYALLFPAEDWYQEFPKAAKRWIRPEKLAKEIGRIREKTIEFEEQLHKVGLDIHKAYAAMAKFRELFFEPGGRYFWFFDEMKLAHREGSYLFVHAGVDDTVAKTLFEEGTDSLNRQFRDELHKDPFALYHGPLGNAFRTKYRSFDFDFTDKGVDSLHRSGLHAIVHGHRNILQGQRVVIRQGMLNFECDASVDCRTRELEGLFGPGGAVLKFLPDGAVHGISTDYPFIKSFHPGFVTIFNRSRGANLDATVDAKQESQHGDVANV